MKLVENYRCLLILLGGAVCHVCFVLLSLCARVQSCMLHVSSFSLPL